MYKEKIIFNFNNFSIPLKSLLIILPFVTILLGLGFWQLKRLKVKNAFIHAIENNMNNSPLEGELMKKIPIYSKIKIKGSFLPNKNIFLYGRRSTAIEKDGYYLLTPFRTNDNKIIIINRGWVMASQKANILDSIHNSENEEEQIIGITLAGEKKRFFLPENDYVKNILFTLNLEEIEKVLALKLEKYYLLQIEPVSSQFNLKTISINSLISIRNDHLEYAFTWFSLAIALIIIFIFYHKKVGLK